MLCGGKSSPFGWSTGTRITRASGATGATHEGFFMSVKIRSGYGIIHQCVMVKSTISRDARCLYALIQSYSGSTGRCWPAVDTLSKHLGCSERSIQNWLSELEKNGLMEIERRDGQTNVFHPLVPEDIEGVNRDAPLPRTGVHPGGAPAFTQTVSMNTISEQEDVPESTPVVPDDASHPPVPTKRKVFYDYDKKVWKLTETDIEFWEECYEGVDVRKELFHMKAWLSAHPKKKDFNRFITSWLSRSQDRSTTFARRAR